MRLTTTEKRERDIENYFPSTSLVEMQVDSLCLLEDQVWSVLEIIANDRLIFDFSSITRLIAASPHNESLLAELMKQIIIIGDYNLVDFAPEICELMSKHPQHPITKIIRRRLKPLAENQLMKQYEEERLA